MKTCLKAILAFFILTGALAGCSAHYNYCRDLQRESPLPFTVEACSKCHERYGDTDPNAIIGCSVGLDVADVLVE